MEIMVNSSSPAGIKNKGSMLIPALLFSISAGFYLNGFIYAISRFCHLDLSRRDGYTTISILKWLFYGAEYLFGLIGVILLLIYTALQYRRGKRPLVVGIGFLLFAAASLMRIAYGFVSGFNYQAYSFIISFYPKLWVRTGLLDTLFSVVLVVLFIITAVYAFSGRRFSAPGTFAGAVYIVGYTAMTLRMFLPELIRRASTSNDVYLYYGYKNYYIMIVVYSLVGLGIMLFSLLYCPTNKTNQNAGAAVCETENGVNHEY